MYPSKPLLACLSLEDPLLPVGSFHAFPCITTLTLVLFVFVLFHLITTLTTSSFYNDYLNSCSKMAPPPMSDEERMKYARQLQSFFGSSDGGKARGRGGVSDGPRTQNRTQQATRGRIPSNA